jgi:hypothetical protein
MLWTGAGVGSSRTPTDTAAARTTRFTGPTDSAHTGADLLTEKQKDRLVDLFASDEHVQAEATWGIYQRTIAAYREPDRVKGRELMIKLIESVSHGVPAALSELVTLGRTLKKRADDVLAWSGPAPATDRLRRSTAGSRTCTGQPSGSTT